MLALKATFTKVSPKVNAANVLGLDPGTIHSPQHSLGQELITPGAAKPGAGALPMRESAAQGGSRWGGQRRGVGLSVHQSSRSLLTVEVFPALHDTGHTYYSIITTPHLQIILS